MPEQPPFGPDPDPASDPAFDSLRDADPMARAGADHSDDEAIREHVRSRLAEQAAPQRRRPWLTVAAAAAAAIVIGGGGYLVGAAVTDRPVQTAGDVQPSISAPITDGPVETVEGPAVGGAAPEAATAPQQNRDESAGTQASLASPSADKMSALWSGRTEFGQQGLSTEAPADGEVSAINSVVPDPAVLTAVGAIVGIEGEVLDTSSGDWKSWSLGSQDGTGPSAYLDGSGSLSLNDPSAWAAWNSCGAVAGSEPAVDPLVDPVPSPDMSILPVEPCTPSEPLPPLDRTAAEETIRSILTAAGLDAASYTITWGEDTGDGQSYATVDPGWLSAGGTTAERLAVWVPGTWNFNWIGDTFAGANGVISTLSPAGSYPLISPADAVERLSDPRFGQPSLVSQPETGSEPWQPPTPGAFTGGPIPWPVAQVTITSAELQQSALSLSNGVTLLAPTYRLASADGFVWEVSALADSAFDFAS